LFERLTNRTWPPRKVSPRKYGMDPTGCVGRDVEVVRFLGIKRPGSREGGEYVETGTDGRTKARAEQRKL